MRKILTTSPTKVISLSDLSKFQSENLKNSDKTFLTFADLIRKLENLLHDYFFCPVHGTTRKDYFLNRCYIENKTYKACLCLDGKHKWKEGTKKPKGELHYIEQLIW